MIVVGNINHKHVKSLKSANEADSMKELEFWNWNFPVHTCTLKPWRANSSLVQRQLKTLKSESIFNRVNFLTCRCLKRFEKYFSSCWNMTPGINFMTFGLNFQGWNWSPGQYSTLKNDPRVNFQPGSRFFVTPPFTFDINGKPTYCFSTSFVLAILFYASCAGNFSETVRLILMKHLDQIDIYINWMHICLSYWSLNYFKRVLLNRKRY